MKNNQSHQMALAELLGAKQVFLFSNSIHQDVGSNPTPGTISPGTITTNARP